MQKSIEGNEISYNLSSDDMYYPALKYNAACINSRYYTITSHNFSNIHIPAL